jgi:hypothetical protein
MAMIGNGVPKRYGFTPFFVSAFVREAAMQGHAYLHVLLTWFSVSLGRNHEGCDEAADPSVLLWAL